MDETESEIENRKSKIEIAHAHSSRRLDEEALRALLLRIVRAEEGRLRSLSVVLAGRERVLQLNRRYLGRDAPTDVLAFPFTGEEGGQDNVVDGEIYVDLDTAAERCAEFGASFEEEARRYAAHGLLHLLGYRDKTDAGRRQMRTLEDRYLR